MWTCLDTDLGPGDDFERESVHGLGLGCETRSNSSHGLERAAILHQVSVEGETTSLLGLDLFILKDETFLKSWNNNNKVVDVAKTTINSKLSACTKFWLLDTFFLYWDFEKVKKIDQSPFKQRININNILTLQAHLIEKMGKTNLSKTSTEGAT